MYYLRSRYYDAYCARFVNADYLINTPTAFSCNGFCYCSNNPCNDIDTDGTFGNGTIHYEVCVDIVARNPGIYMNLTKVVPGRNGSFGLCDLVSDSGQIWEVKRVTCAPLLAVRQLNAYLSSTFQNRPGLIDEQACSFRILDISSAIWTPELASFCMITADQTSAPHQRKSRKSYVSELNQEHQSTHPFLRRFLYMLQNQSSR